MTVYENNNKKEPWKKHWHTPDLVFAYLRTLSHWLYRQIVGLRVNYTSREDKRSGRGLL